MKGGFFDRLTFRLRSTGAMALGVFRANRLRAQGAHIGPRTVVPRIRLTWPHQLQLGAACRLEEDIYFKFDGIWCPGPSIRIGDGVFIGRGCEFNIRNSIRLGNHCLVGSGAKFVDHDHGIRPGELICAQAGPEAPIDIGRDVWIGDNVIVLKGVTIGDGAVIGAAAVVTKSVGPQEIWAGVPAKRVGIRS